MPFQWFDNRRHTNSWRTPKYVIVTQLCLDPSCLILWNICYLLTSEYYFLDDTYLFNYCHFEVCSSCLFINFLFIAWYLWHLPKVIILSPELIYLSLCTLKEVYMFCDIICLFCYTIQGLFSISFFHLNEWTILCICDIYLRNKPLFTNLVISYFSWLLNSRFY